MSLWLISTYDLIRISSSSQILSWTTSSAWPSCVASKLSSPSKFARFTTIVAVKRNVLLGNWRSFFQKQFTLEHVPNSGPRTNFVLKCNHNWVMRSYQMCMRAGPRLMLYLISNLISHEFVISRFGCYRFCV